MADRCHMTRGLDSDWGAGLGQGQLERRLLRRVLRYFRPYWRHALAALGCVAAGAGLGLAPALVTKTVIDYLASADRHYPFVVLLVLAGVAASLVAAAIGVAQAYLTQKISQGIMFDLRAQLFDRMLSQSLGFFTVTRTGDVMSRIGNDVRSVEGVVSETLFELAVSGFTLVGTLAVMIALDWRLTVLVLLVMPLAIVPARRLGTAMYRASGRTQGKLAEMTAYLQEMLGISGVLLAKAFARDRAERARFAALNGELRRLQIKQDLVDRWFRMFMQTLTAVGPALLWLAGGYLVVTGQASLGTVVTFIVVLGMRFTGAVSSLSGMHVNVIGSLAVFRRIFEALDAPIEVADAPDARPLPRARGAVELDRVTFRYPGTSTPALRDVSFAIEPGQLTALVGLSGAGKTTVTYLISRLYDPESGTVRIDGHDLRTVTLESLRQSMGIVFQDAYLFHATVRENLLYARPEATQREVEAAARAAHLHDLIESLPDGYDTVVGERGHRLSGGEKQRMAIARVILADPRILLLDEATSSLDSVSEQLVQSALHRLFAGRTAVVIAHRLSTVMAADAILVFDEGRLVQRGRHAELVAQDGLYRTLYERQFGGAPPVAAAAQA